MQILELINDKFKQIPIVYIVIAAFVISGYSFWSSYSGKVKPLKETIKAKETEVKRLNIRLKSAEKVIQNVEGFKKEISRLQVELEEELRKLPNTAEIPELLLNISVIGKRLGIKFDLFEPQPEKQTGNFYVEVPIKIQITGSFVEVTTFFDRLSRLPRIITVSNIRMAKGNQSTGGNPRTDAMLTTYRYVGSTAGQPAKKPTGGRRGG
jgi:type IV pilus assembly protein PilO